MTNQNNSKNSTNTQNNSNKSLILTLRIPSELKDRILKISQRLNIKLSKAAQNYLELSDFLIIRGDRSIIGYDNDNITLFPSSIITEFFRILNTDINSANRFQIWLELGDKLGIYLNNIFLLLEIPPNDFLKMFEIIQNLGWFKYQVIDNTIVIPKTFGSKPLIYSMVYRIVTKLKHPPNWTPELLDLKYPYNKNTSDKKEKQINREFESNYENIRNTIDPDLEKENILNFYFFRKLKI
ncbi:MAG: hypothetical protein ACTSU2_11250 [Promethearchaeota archaeon]